MTDVVASTNHQTDLTLLGKVSATQVTTAYNTLPDNQPNTNGNATWLWQATNQIPWTTPTQFTEAIPTNTQNGSTTITGEFTIDQSFLVGYAAGPNLTGSGQQLYGNICSTVFIPVSGKSVPFVTTVTINTIAANTVAVSYSTPAGCTPQANGAWLGMWRGSAASYSIQPDWYCQPGNSAEGDTAFNGVTILRGTQYTIAYFMSGWAGGEGHNNNLTPMAYTVTFG